MTRKTALITGITGQDGSYLAEFLLEKGYRVHGIKRRSSLFNTERIDHLYQDPHAPNPHTHAPLRRSHRQLEPLPNHERGKAGRDLQPRRSVARRRVVRSRRSTRPTWMPSARCACSRPSASSAWRRPARFYQASTSELFGMVQETPAAGDHAVPSALALRGGQAVRLLDHRELPRRPMACTPATACCSITSRRVRGETFVTRKITRGLANIALGLESCLFLGNLAARRDWGHARDYVRMQWMMLQQDEARGLRHRHRPADLGTRVRRAGRRLRRHHAVVRRRRCRRGGHRHGGGSWIRGAGGEAGDVIVRRRSPLLPAGRGGDPAGRSEQGANAARLAAGDPLEAMWSRRWSQCDLAKARQYALLKEHGHAVILP